jgi:phage minor structural protein
MEVVGVKPVLFNETDTNYDHNGIGVLYDAESCIVTEEYNGAFDMELSYPADGDWAKELLNGRQILAKPNDVDDPHTFRIYDTIKDLEAGTITVKATSITDDLGGNLIVNATVTDATAQQALDTIKQNLIESTRFNLVSDIQTKSSSEWTRISPLSAIAGTSGSLIDHWGGNIKRTNDTIYLYSRRGKDHVTTIRPGKNIDGFNMVTSNKGVITKILPFYTYTPDNMPRYQMVDDGTGNMVKQQDYYSSSEAHTQPEPVTVLGDVVSSQNADNYPVHNYTPVDYSQNQTINDQVKAYMKSRLDEADNSSTIIDESGYLGDVFNYALTLLNQEASKYFTYSNPGCDKPNVRIEVDMIELSDSPEWERYKNLESIQLTDTVDVYVQKFNVDVTVTIQSIEYDSIGERVLKITAGSAQNNLVESITKTYEDQTKKLQDYISTMENGVYNTISKTADGQSSRFSGYTQPSDDISKEGDMWFKQVGNGKVESYIYNGGLWIPVISEETIQSMNQAIVNAQNTADLAESQAQTTADDINSVVVNNGYTTLADLIASKVSTGDYGTLFAQNAKSIGLFYEVDGVTQAMIILDNGVPYIKGNNIVLDGDTIVDGTFTVTDTMIAPEAVTKKLIAEGIDAKNVTIINLDASSITGGDLTVTESFRIMYNNSPVLEVDAATGQVKISAPNLATKDDLNNIELTPGPQGVGISSVTEYYLATNTSSGVTTASSGWTTAVQTITNTNKYLWNYEKVLYTDGTTSVTSPIIIGTYGDTGNTGAAGKSISSITEYYLATSASSGVTTATTGWTTTVQTTTPTSKYLWNYEKITYTDGSTTTINPVIIGTHGDTGPQGPQGLQGIQGPQGDQGIQGPKGADGTSSYTHIAYATNSTGTTGFNTSDGTNATYIGMYVDNVQNDSTDPSKYQWTLIKGADGAQGIQGPAGVNGQTPYLHIAYATNATGTTGFDTTVSSGKTYIGTYTDFLADDSTDPSKYSWSLIQGPQGNTGAAGKGVSSVTEYYLVSSASSGVTTSTSGWSTTIPTLTATNRYLWNYEKVTYTDNSTTTTSPVVIGVYGDKGDTGSTGAQGPQGIQGPKGTDGTTYYTWIKYADTPTSGMTDDPTGKTYMGIAYNKLSSTESTTYSDYSWSLIQGPQGNQGIQGPTGPQGQATYTWIKYADDASGTNMNDSPTGKKYMGIAYNKTTATESAVTTDYSWSLIQGPQGPQGNTGAAGKGVSSVAEYYLATNASSGVTTSTSGWSTTIPTITTTNNYLWNYEKVTYTDGSTSTTSPVIIGAYGPQGIQGIQGAQGPQGIQGPTGPQGQATYTWVKYGTSSTGANMTDDPTGMTYIGLAYNKTTATESSTASDYTWSLIQGPQGIQGPTGPQGQATYTWIKYADDASGTNMNDSPTGKKYMGIAYNKTTATESTTATDYSWSLIQGPQGVKGDTGSTGAAGKGVSSVAEYYLVSSASSGVTTSTSGWSTTIPTLTATNKYLWNYEKVTYTDSSTSTTSPVIIGVYGDTGAQGPQGVQGPQGIQGPTGPQGQATYTWVKYATSSAGANMSDDPTGMTYIGLAYNKTTQTESSTASDYTWSLIQGPQGPQGSQGIQGPTGPSGQTYWTWIKYADDVNGTNITDDPTGKKYMGIAYNKTTSTESTVATDYSWSLIQGPQGSTGATGKGISSVTEYYLATSASSGVTTATAGWTTTVQTITSTNKYLWNYEKVTYTDGSTSTTTPVIIGVYGDTGGTGATGKGISSVTEYYLATSASSGVTTSTSGWTTSMQSITATNKYLWNYEKITYTDNSTVNIAPVIIGAYGDTGAQGPAGSPANSIYTWIMYADDKNGTNITSNPSGKPWRGKAYNKTTATPSTTATDYTWEFIMDSWVKTGTIKMDGGQIVADSLSAISANLGNITAGNITGVTMNLANGKFVVDDKGNLTMSGALNGATGTFSGTLSSPSIAVVNPNYINDGFVKLTMDRMTISDSGGYKRTGTIEISSEFNRIVIRGSSGYGDTTYGAQGGLYVPSGGIETDSLSTHGSITNGGFDFALGTYDQSSRGDSGASRAMVKDGGNVLAINYQNDFRGGTRVDGSLYVNGTTTAAGTEYYGQNADWNNVSRTGFFRADSGNHAPNSWDSWTWHYMMNVMHDGNYQWQEGVHYDGRSRGVRVKNGNNWTPWWYYQVGRWGTQRCYQYDPTRAKGTVSHNLGQAPNNLLVALIWNSGSMSMTYIGECYAENVGSTSFDIQVTNMNGYSLPAGGWVDVLWTATAN